ncbi:hypothetical protein [Aureimonas sp. AU4]|uniref:hypothetical protein n=1 Tax=Aureimonas sp. AU4 TaxID=1638163 RepID=UPI000781BB18|nr:hypothetical protein [Aureimonas sp. AU4]
MTTDTLLSPEALQPLSRALERIHQWNVSSETVYLGAGEDLQTLHRRIGTVRDGIRRTTETVSSADGDRVEALLAGAAEAATDLEAAARERTRLLRTLSDGVTLSAGGSAAVALVFRLLDYVVLVARTHVEGMSEGRDVLVPFTEHVHELVSSGQAVAGSLDERVRVLRGHIEESRAIDNRVGARAAIGEPSLAFQFKGLIRRLAMERDTLADTRQEAHRSFSTIRDAVGGLVMGLQFHDIARQRLEHTLGNLERFLLLAAEGKLAHDAPALAPKARNLAVRRIAELEIAQLQSLASLYETRMGELHGNLTVIEDELLASDRLLASLFREGASGEGRSAMAVLESETSRLRQRFQRGENDRRQLDESLRECVEAADPLIAMTDELGALEHTLRLAGFNAAVRAAHVDSGDETIGYIAREIREQATAAKVQADTVREGIEASVGATRELEASVLPAIRRAENAISTQFEEATALLARIESDCQSEMRAASGQAEGLSGRVRTISTLMTPHVEGCALMREAVALLEAMLRGLPDETASLEDARDLHGLLAGQYTMAEERQIFEASFRGQLGAAPAAPVAAAAADDIDDLLF